MIYFDFERTAETNIWKDVWWDRTWRWGEAGDSSQSFSSDTLQGISSEWSGGTTELVYIETNKSVHNAKVRENREILKDLIDVNCFPAKQQLAVCSNNESSISSNRGNYVELLHTLAAKDEKLARHFRE